jgi:hypothetical protein
MHRFRAMKDEDSLKEARTIAISVAPYYHPKLAAKQVHSIHDVGDRLDALLRHLDGRATNKISGAMGRPALAVVKPVLDIEQGGSADEVRAELDADSAPDGDA